MSLLVKRNGGIPSLLSNFFGPSLFDTDVIDFVSSRFPRLGITVPTANFAETPTEYRIELAAPGLERKDFNIEVENNTLTISAEKEEEKKDSEEGYSRKEYSFNSFTRTFTLPEDVKEGDIEAKYENGILKVTLPKVKESVVKQARRVSVK